MAPAACAEGSFVAGKGAASPSPCSANPVDGDIARRKVWREEMLPDEMLAELKECPVCYVAYGLAEPHGAYNAIGLDWLKAHAIAERAARTHGGIVAPPFAWHVSENPNLEWCGSQGMRQSPCSSIPADLFLRTVLHQIRAIDTRGFRAAAPSGAKVPVGLPPKMTHCEHRNTAESEQRH